MAPLRVSGDDDGNRHRPDVHRSTARLRPRDRAGERAARRAGANDAQLIDVAVELAPDVDLTAALTASETCAPFESVNETFVPVANSP